MKTQNSSQIVTVLEVREVPAMHVRNRETVFILSMT